MSSETPSELFYTQSHEWVRVEGDEVVIGITNHAQMELGDVVFVELPEVGTIFDAEDEFGTVESVKAVSELYMPVAGEVVAVNSDLLNSPELINENPYAEGWMVRVRPSGEYQSRLLSAAAYADYIENSNH